VEVSWQLDDASYLTQVNGLLRAHDDLGVRELIDALRRAAFEMTAAEVRPEDVETLLDRATCLGALILRAENDRLFDQWLTMMGDVYSRGFDANGFPRNLWGTDTAVFWLEIVERVIAIGGLAVRERSFRAARKLASQGASGRDFQSGHYNNWVHHALVMASRSGLFQRTEQNQEVHLSLLVLAQRQACRLACLRPDLPSDDEAVLNSLCQFDMVVALTAIDVGGTRTSSDYFYPNFARFYSHRTEPIVELLVRDPAVRAIVFSGNDQQLADALRAVDGVAHSEGFRFSGWYGFESPQIVAFLEAIPPTA
jgi:hypothetical protein